MENSKFEPLSPARQREIAAENIDGVDFAVHLIGTTFDIVKIQVQRLVAVIPLRSVCRLLVMPFASVSNHVVGDHRSLVRAMEEAIPITARGRVCVHYGLLNVSSYAEPTVDTITLADVRHLAEAIAPFPGISHRYEHYGISKCPTLSPSYAVLPKSFNDHSGKSVEKEGESSRILALENELLALKEQLLQLASLRDSDKTPYGSGRGSPPPEPSSSKVSLTIPIPPPPPPPLPIPPAPPLPVVKIPAIVVSREEDVTVRLTNPTKAATMNNIFEEMKMVKLRPIALSRSPGGTPVRRRSLAGRRRSGQQVDHGSLISEALRKKVVYLNGDQSPHKNLEPSDEEQEWNSSFEDTPDGTPVQSSAQRQVRINRMPRTLTPEVLEGALACSQ